MKLRIGDLVLYHGLVTPPELGVFTGYATRAGAQLNLFWDVSQGAESSTLIFLDLLRRVDLPEDNR